MIDARNIYRKVNRKICDFLPEQLKRLTAIVWLYRGQSERFLALVQNYFGRTLGEAAGIAEKAAAFKKQYDPAAFLYSGRRGESGHGCAGASAPPPSR
jgi:type I restriction enzyme M protein